MTKQLIVDMSRHLDSLRYEGKKHDAPSPVGMIEEAPRVGRALKIPDGGIWFYRSRAARTAAGIALIAYHAGINDLRVQTVDALNSMKRCSEDEAEIKRITKGIEERVEYENRVVAYCANPTNLHPRTELPTQVGARYQGHVHNLARHFEDIQNGQTARVFNMGHEPCLTMLVMQVTGKKYNAREFGGAARTAEAIRFTMEDTGSGIVQVKMQYRSIKASYTIR